MHSVNDRAIIVMKDIMSNLLSIPTPSARRGGFIGDMVGWFIRIVIYDMCITGISNVLGVSRMVALFIFLGILLAIGFVGYLVRRKMGGEADADV
jgi:hypothetical protein